ncbi:Glu-tRNA(Gln) amidotransferase subunit GatD [Methanoplanus sp. FWC-SCC4]|uniref:Glutamyl-tRNA(Gln) amidotransferase subunit D n=1 Tax=Methanochimaera problematica TaxID=2609417 RepID=A0AA97I2B6_9EURY|nr:Glu-tRNA(Gln) amidotransferase subunit GatD [Methanoplanus sp. FWC-SCC4]WOF15448.1 Glu-tRNA(Gln) amidotransferase subunit GatD [Methanoplanus sp. FWC-SCC4]
MNSGDKVFCTYADTRLKGTYITERDGKAVIKLDSGYNIGVEPALVEKSESVPAKHPEPKKIEQNEKLSKLSIISTGGTIASKIDYRTGAVTSQFEADDIIRAIPGLKDIAFFNAHVPATILSENMTPTIWRTLAKTIYDEINSGVEGIIVTHGTDTLAYSAAAMSFMVETPVPVIFVGSQRSADRPSSDNVMNGMCSAAAAKSDLGEVAVVMHATTNDDTCAIHRGTRVRKMHTSRRDAFRSVNTPPLGKVDYPSLDVKLDSHAVRRGTNEPVLNDKLEEKVGLIYFYPGMAPEIIRAHDRYKGLIIAGTGLGHTSSACIDSIRELCENGTEIVMTSQCLNGRVCDRVYDTGRDLLAAGIIEGEDMLPEAAFVKLMWVLGQENDHDRIKELMQTNLRGETGGCTPHGL